MADDTTTDYSQPVAYDAEGRPLYAHPPTTVPTATATSHVTAAPDKYEGHNFDPKMRVQYGNEPDVVHATRPIEPDPLAVSDELQQRHEASMQKYPYLNLSKGEFVMLNISRHPIGLAIPIGITALIVALMISVVAAYPFFVDTAMVSLPPVSSLLFPVLALILLAVLGGAVTVWVYLQNQFFLTNESVIQEIQISLFSRHEQTVSLGSIEDASFKKQGFLQTLFDYGTIRLSTEGEETTYRFAYVKNPKHQVAIVNNAVEAFKNGRPVELID